VDCLEMKFLYPKVGSENMLEDTPEHLPDISNILLCDIIACVSKKLFDHSSRYYSFFTYETSKTT